MKKWKTNPMFSLLSNVDDEKKEVSNVGLKTILKELDISYSTMWRWMRKGCPYYKVQGGRKLTFNRDKVEKWLEEQTI